MAPAPRVAWARPRNTKTVVCYCTRCGYPMAVSGDRLVSLRPRRVDWIVDLEDPELAVKLMELPSDVSHQVRDGDGFLLADEHEEFAFLELPVVFEPGHEKLRADSTWIADKVKEHLAEFARRGEAATPVVASPPPAEPPPEVLAHRERLLAARAAELAELAPQPTPKPEGT